MAFARHGWDEYTPTVSRRSSRWAISARGWLFGAGESSVGNYLDYGPDHYRSPHEYCKAGACDCRESQPGNIHCVCFTVVDGLFKKSRYVETIEEAKAWIEEQSGYHKAIA